MKRSALGLLFVIGFVAAAMSQTASDPNEGARLSRGSANSYTFLWFGHAGRTYFLQHSDDLMTWVYFPDLIEQGLNDPLSYGFTASEPVRFFLRLKSTDIPTGNPSTADFDGDGLSNFDELQRGTDPLNPDTDGDGLNDGWELAIGLDPQVAGAVPSDTDGVLGLTVYSTLE